MTGILPPGPDSLHPRFTVHRSPSSPSPQNLRARRCVVDNNRTGTIGYLQQPAPVVCGGSYNCGEVLPPVGAPPARPA